MKKSYVRYGFLIAGLLNIGSVLIFTRAFTNDLLFAVDPTVISRFGLLMVMLWGLAAIAASGHALQLAWLSLVLALEKFCYAAVWLFWITTRTLPIGTLYKEDILSGLFFTIYGPFDFMLMCFFCWVFWLAKRTASENDSASD